MAGRRLCPAHRRGGGAVIHELGRAGRDQREDAGGHESGVVGGQLRRGSPGDLVGEADGAGHRGQDRDARCHAELTAGVEQGGGGAGVGGRNVGKRGSLQRHQGLGPAQAQGEHQGAQPPQAGAGPDGSHQRDRRGDAEHAPGHHPARPGPRVHPGGDLRAGHDADRLGEGTEPGVQRGQPEPVLQEQRDQVQAAEEGHHAGEQDRRGAGEQPVP
jgi:hypothetical protein